MPVTREIQPWDGLLEAGRADERLVMQTAQNARRGRRAPLPQGQHPDGAPALEGAGGD